MSKLVELDQLRCDLMEKYLNEKGCSYIWMYDVTTPQAALDDALYYQNYDNMKTYQENKAKPYVLIGPGIEDHYFSNENELEKLIRWLCVDGGYLSCYKKEC